MSSSSDFVAEHGGYIGAKGMTEDPQLANTVHTNTETIGLFRDGKKEGVWRWGKRENIYAYRKHLSPPE